MTEEMTLDWLSAILVARQETYLELKMVSEELREIHYTYIEGSQQDYIYLKNSIANRYNALLEDMDFYEDWVYNINLHTKNNVLLFSGRLK